MMRTVAILLLLARAAFSHLAATCNCSDLLRLRLTDEIRETFRSNAGYTETFQLCDASNASECQNKNWSAGINVMIYNVPIGLRGGQASGQCQKLYKAFCQRGQSTAFEAIALDTARSLLSNAALETVVKAWRQCVKENPLNGDLSPVRIVASFPRKVGESFPLKISFGSAARGCVAPKIVAVQSSDAVQCSWDSLRRVIGAELAGNAAELLCKRTGANAGAVIIATTWGDKGVDVPRIPAQAEHPAPAPPPAAPVAAPISKEAQAFTAANENVRNGRANSCGTGSLEPNNPFHQTWVRYAVHVDAPGQYTLCVEAQGGDHERRVDVTVDQTTMPTPLLVPATGRVEPDHYRWVRYDTLLRELLVGPHELQLFSNNYFPSCLRSLRLLPRSTDNPPSCTP
jgi:hypothetical protein